MVHCLYIAFNVVLQNERCPEALETSTTNRLPNQMCKIARSSRSTLAYGDEGTRRNGRLATASLSGASQAMTQVYRVPC